MDWLEVSDAVYVCNYREDSKGTKAEIDRALELGIPVFFTLNETLEYFKGG